MWISLIIALVTYLLAPKNNAKERQKALIGAAVAGGVTYGVTEYTDWGNENLKPINDSIGSVFEGSPKSDDPRNGVPTTGGKTPANQASASSSGLLDAVKNIGPAGAAALGFGAGAVTSDKTKVLLIGAAVLAAVLLLKD